MNSTILPETEDQPVQFPTDFVQITDRMNKINPVQYGRTRNFLNGAVTYLSPYISRGVISTKQVKNLILKQGFKSIEVEKILQELAWREYYQRIWQAIGNGILSDIKQAQPFVIHHKMVSGIENASTGIDIIDQEINQFYSSGYLHNHMRMYIASMACNIAKAHWLQPSQWMYYHLLDGDIASNNCSWQWVAAAFSSKKYYFNQENVNKYTFSKQEHSYLDKSYEDIIKMAVPEALQSTSEFAPETNLPSHSFPLLDTNRPTLIYNSYNLDPEWRKNESCNRILLLEPSHFKKYPVSDKVIEFIIALSGNIDKIQIYTGEIEDIVLAYQQSPLKDNCIISKEHPAFSNYPGQKDSREWMFPEVNGYHQSFFSYWKKCEKYLK